MQFFLKLLLEWQCWPRSDCSIRSALFACIILSDTVMYEILGHLSYVFILKKNSEDYVTSHLFKIPGAGTSTCRWDFTICLSKKCRDLWQGSHLFLDSVGPEITGALSFTTLWASSEDKMIYIMYFSQKTGFDIGDNLHETAQPVFWEK